MEKHITLAAVLNLGLGILGVLGAIFILIAIVSAGIISRDPHALRVISIVGTMLAFFLMVLSVTWIIGGIGLLKRKSWARILLLVLSVLALLKIPLGTALGIYTIWVLIQDETKALLESSTDKSTMTA